ncbi:prepilin-type N-terminal cleavage/methylation domain-containing protein [Sphaerotilus mobilis]|uniref:MSHA pilin protein MshC n=1 Tax=Sphaerotilus mobilis TaxID=47994 RepID=A0A4Q7LE49_9BURK|nr:prepilin-type N-terminal cleavage/methylation domain-containing protein [Sphaerotilus mobilis]RZS52223.1 MSHA pilin protein MshC [Sphaerotilus mobilis]
MALSRPAPTHPHHAHPGGRGYTLVELIAVLVMVGVMAVVALPRWSSTTQVQGQAWRDGVVATLRQGHALARGHRRVVCASFDNASPPVLRLRIASAFGASDCSADLIGPDGQPIALVAPRGWTVTASPSRTLYFLPSGGVGESATATTTSRYTFDAGDVATITVEGLHGRVQ